jgi:hypothetical protein
MSFLLYDAVMKIFAGFPISPPQTFRGLSVDWTNIRTAITSRSDKENQYERKA